MNEGAQISIRSRAVLAFPRPPTPSRLPPLSNRDACAENLQSGGKNIGVISHVPAMQEHIAAQINVTKESGGCSRVRILA
jgi:hypothetical protein